MRERGRRWTRALAAMATLAALAAPIAARATVPSLTLSPSRIKPVPDFSSTFRGYWWDFADETHFSVEDTREGFANPRLVDGWWVATSVVRSQSREADGAVRLSHLNIDGPEPTNWEPSEFRHIPLAPAYRYLTYRMCSSAASHTMVRWLADATKDDRDYGGTVFADVRVGCWLYSFDLVKDRNEGVGTLPWHDPDHPQSMYALEIRPVSDSGISVQLDFVTLSNQVAGPTVSVAWEGAQEPVSLYIARVDDGAQRTLIAADRTGGSYDWPTPGLAPGTYSVIAVAATGEAAGTAELVVDAPPTGRILDPSPTTGPDYATVEVGDPWDMSNPEDIERPLGVTHTSFTQGIYRAESVAAAKGDPRLFLHVTKPIDPSRYHYLTYRMWVGGEGILAGTGGVFRAYWFQNGSWSLPDRSYTQDLRVYKGWRTVTIDLADAYLQAADIGPWGRTPALTDFRIDPHESPTPRAFYLDWVMLTGDRVADTAYFRIIYEAEDPDGGGTTPPARFFYDTDRNPIGGPGARVPVTCAGDPGPPPGVLSCRWRTAGVTAGDYFIHMLLTDAAGNRTWVTSEVPLLVRHNP
jgi:hypothetical protein